MKQIVESLRAGETRLLAVPAPIVRTNEVLVEVAASLISAGTERMVVEFARANLFNKLRSQPDRVRQILAKMRTDGIGPTLEAVTSKLDAPLALGYCAAGVVRDVGGGVRTLRVGDRVVTNGPHAEFVAVGENLCATIPDEVSFEDAAFAPVAAISLHAIRMAAPTIGEVVVVYGLGLIGLLAVQILRASGCVVIGVDTSPERCRIAATFGATGLVADAALASKVWSLTGGVGADAVLMTLATSRQEPMQLAAEMSRKRGRIILVGTTGLELQRDLFYKKELSFQVSCSYGPGRHDPNYEEQGIDYPLAYVRWTEGRNFSAVLQLMADKRIDVRPLVTHRFEIDGASAAYDALLADDSALGIVLGYDDTPPKAIKRQVGQAHMVGSSANGRPGIALIGAGNFGARVLAPAFTRAGAIPIAVVSRAGVSASALAARFGFRRASTEFEVALADPAVEIVIIATPHNSHASLAEQALLAGKHVFVEKPLAINDNDVLRLALVAGSSERQLCVGFNRRFAPDVVALRDAMGGRLGPAIVSILVNAGRVPAEHWLRNTVVGGGRVVGEGCHFVDLARALIGCEIAGASVHSTRGNSSGGEPSVSITVSFADGSIATIQYCTDGNRAVPKERIDVHFDGKSATIDNYRSLTTYGFRAGNRRLFRRMSKGYEDMASAFLRSVCGGGQPLIPLAEVVEVSRWSIVIAALAAVGGGSQTSLPDVADQASV